MLGSAMIVAFGAMWAATPHGGTPASSDTAASLRQFHDIHAEMRALLRAEAAAKTPDQRGAAIQRMAALYREITEDPRLATSDTLKKYKAKLWSRLTRIKKDLEHQLQREAKTGKRGEGDDERQAIDLGTYADPDEHTLKNATGGADPYGSKPPGGALGGRTSYDYGQQLIDLIQRTIQPDSWDVNGGQGTIFYYRPLMALVVRATSEVHRNVAGLLQAMRAAGP